MMKKTMIALMALAGVASATSEIILDTNFTTTSGSCPTGWTEGRWQGGDGDVYNFTADGASNKNQWKQNHLDCAITLTSEVDYYTIEFQMASKGEAGNMFYLSGDNYSILVGQSYNDVKEVGVGTENGAINGFISFQEKGSQNTPDTVLATSNVGFGYGTAATPVTMNYTLTLSAGKLLVSVSDGTHTWNSGDLTISNDFSFTKVGFINDASSGNAITKSIRITATPEPATATLSLLALAGLASRRRRH